MYTVIPRENSVTGTPNTDRWPTPDIWYDCDPNLFDDHPARNGIRIWEDWSQMPIIATPTITTEAIYGNGWKAFGSAGGTILPARIEGGGGLILTETDDNEGIGMQYVQTPFKLAPGKGKLWFEGRLKTNEVANTKHGFFLGLMELVTLSATVPIAAAGTLTDNNFVGFHRLEGDGDQIDTVYKANGVTQVTVQADAIPTGTSLAADTYIKLGMVFDPKDNRLTFYFNGLRASTSKLLPAAEGTDFPNDVLLAPTLAMLCASNDDAIITWDWIQVAQLF